MAAVTVLAGTAVGATEEGVSFDPDRIELALHEGASATEEVTAHLPADITVPQADVYLLADTTGSMGGPIAAVRAGASDIVEGLADELPGADLQFAVGDFKDFPSDDYAFNHAVDVTEDTGAVQAAIDQWFATGGFDRPEGQFYAYDRLAAGFSADGDPIGWREGSKRILVVFGDAPAHDPVCAALTGLDYDITEASVTGALQEAEITFIGISTGFGGGMDDHPSGFDYSSHCGVSAGEAGQATRLAEATNGAHLLGVQSSEIVAAIKEQITQAVRTINTIELRPTGGITPFVTSVEAVIPLPLTTDEPHDLVFEVGFTGPGCVTAGTVFSGTLDLLADGQVLGQATVELESLGPDGLAALHDTPADGLASGTIAREVVPVLREADDALGDLVTTVNCDVVAPTEDTVDGFPN